jgi:predicted ArsR family transcriptional regulator
MIHLTDKQIVEFLRRSYTAIDGLWFMKMEEKYGFEAALEVDKEVWKVFPRIQARFLKSMSKMDKGIEALVECYTARLAMENFTFHTEKSSDGVKVIIEKCPWHEIMVKSGRRKLSGRIGDIICQTECETWAKEFGEDIRFVSEERICKGAAECIIKFEKLSENP